MIYVPSSLNRPIQEQESWRDIKQGNGRTKGEPATIGMRKAFLIATDEVRLPLQYEKRCLRPIIGSKSWACLSRLSRLLVASAASVFSCRVQTSFRSSDGLVNASLGKTKLTRRYQHIWRFDSRRMHFKMIRLSYRSGDRSHSLVS